MEDLARLAVIVTISAVLLLMVLLFFRGVMSRYRRVGPNQAMLVFGKGKTGVVVGGGRIVWPIWNQAKYLGLELMTISFEVKEVYSGQGVPVDVEAVAQVKIGGDESSILTAAEQFLDRPQEAIQKAALLSLEGHMRAIVGTLTVEEIYRDRDAFAQRVQQVATDDMSGMGLRIVSFAIIQVKDQRQYLESLGRARTAEVIRDAEIGEALARQTSREQVAAATQAAREAELEADARIAEAEKKLSVQKSQFQVEADTKAAEATLAREMREAQIRQELAIREGGVAIEKQKQAALAAEQAVAVAENTQRAQIIIPAAAQRQATVETAEAAAKKVTLEAAAEAERVKAIAGADAERVRLTRTAEGDGTRAVGLAEADANKAKLLAEADGTKAKLLAEAEGEQKLAEARSAQDEVNIRLEAIKRSIEGRVEIAHAMGNAMGQMGGRWNIVQFGGGGNAADGQGSVLEKNLRLIPSLLAEFDAQTRALTGEGLTELLTEVGNIVRGSRVHPVPEAVTPAEAPAAAAPHRRTHLHHEPEGQGEAT